MKKIKSKLFNEFELNKDKQSKVIGGLMNTAVGGDTNVSGGGYDIAFDTLDASGANTGIDTVLTSPKGTTLDKPDC